MERLTTWPKRRYVLNLDMNLISLYQRDARYECKYFTTWPHARLIFWFLHLKSTGTRNTGFHSTTSLSSTPHVPTQFIQEPPSDVSDNYEGTRSLSGKNRVFRRRTPCYRFRKGEEPSSLYSDRFPSSLELGCRHNPFSRHGPISPSLWQASCREWVQNISTSYRSC